MRITVARVGHIEVTPDMADVVDAAEDALLTAPDVEIYQRLGVLVRVTRDEARKIRGLRRPRRAPLVSPVPDPHLRELFARSAWWSKTYKSGDVPSF